MFRVTWLVISMVASTSTRVSISKTSSTTAVVVTVVAILTMSRRWWGARIRRILGRRVMNRARIMRVWLAISIGWRHGFMLVTRANRAIQWRLWSVAIIETATGPSIAIMNYSRLSTTIPLGLVRRGRRSLIGVGLWTAIRGLLRVLSRWVWLSGVIGMVVVRSDRSLWMSMRWMSMLRAPLRLRRRITTSRWVCSAVLRRVMMSRVWLTSVLVLALR